MHSSSILQWYLSEKMCVHWAHTSEKCAPGRKDVQMRYGSLVIRDRTYMYDRVTGFFHDDHQGPRSRPDNGLKIRVQ